MFPIRTILHPTDFSEYSQAAFQLACTLAHDHGARLILLHVATPPALVTYGELDRALERPSGYRRVLEQGLEKLQPPDSGTAVERRLEEGDPTAEILRLASEANCDLIVLGTHGRTGLSRLLMGSVAEQVVRRARCPVLTVKMPTPQAPALEESQAADSARSS
jgi:nucleotide-binding universal stress UspA family protein